MSQIDVINIINAYLKVLKQAGITIDKAFLYGSYARNEAGEDSDIDLMLVSSQFDTDDDYVLATPWIYSSKVDHRIEPLSVGLQRFNSDDTSPVIEIVRQTGIEIQM